MDPTRALIRYCSACDNNSTTYQGKFVGTPHDAEMRRKWLVRVGVIKPTAPVPGGRFYVCDNHFDPQNDFKADLRCGFRLRAGILPWRNLKTGTYTYHDYDQIDTDSEVAPRCRCTCCKNRDKNYSPVIKQGPRVATRALPTNDVECQVKMGPRVATRGLQTDDEEKGGGKVGRITLLNFQCRLCLQGSNLKRLFSYETRQPIDPDLMEQIYVTVGLLLNFDQDRNACICCSCELQVGQAYRFRLQTRCKNQALLAARAMPPQKSGRPQKRQLADIEQVMLESVKVEEQMEDEPPSPESQIADVKKVNSETEGEIDGFLYEVEIKREVKEEPDDSEDFTGFTSALVDTNVKKEC